jgi:hypothetical protein
VKISKPNKVFLNGQKLKIKKLIDLNKQYKNLNLA